MCSLISQRVSGVLSRANATKCEIVLALQIKHVFTAKMIRNRRICPSLDLARLQTRLSSPVSCWAQGALGFHLPGQGSVWIKSSLQIQKLSGVGAHGDKRSQLWIEEAIPLPFPGPQSCRPHPSPDDPPRVLGSGLPSLRSPGEEVAFSNEVRVSARPCRRWGVIPSAQQFL